MSTFGPNFFFFFFFWGGGGVGGDKCREVDFLIFLIFSLKYRLFLGGKKLKNKFITTFDEVIDAVNSNIAENRFWTNCRNSYYYKLPKIFSKMSKF
jgi:hypothetical protein